jgi:hypothetical protein
MVLTPMRASESLFPQVTAPFCEAAARGVHHVCTVTATALCPAGGPRNGPR